jgi:hypothetical protein
MEKINTEWIERVLHARLMDMGRINVLPRITPENWWECDIFSTTKAGFWAEHEIKISRADFKSDFKKTAHFRNGKIMRRKYARWNNVPESFKHTMMAEGSPLAPNQFWICVPEGLVSIEEVPSYAGLVEFPLPKGKKPAPHWSGYMKITKKAPRLHNEKISDERLQKIARQVPYRFQRAYFETIPKLKRQIAELKGKLGQ